MLLLVRSIVSARAEHRRIPRRIRRRVFKVTRRVLIPLSVSVRPSLSLSHGSFMLHGVSLVRNYKNKSINYKKQQH